MGYVRKLDAEENVGAKDEQRFHSSKKHDMKCGARWKKKQEVACGWNQSIKGNKLRRRFSERGLVREPHAEVWRRQREKHVTSVPYGKDGLCKAMWLSCRRYRL